MMVNFDDLIRRGEDIKAVRYLAKEYYDNGKMGHTRKLLLERIAQNFEKLKDERDALLEELDNAQPCFACAGFKRNGGNCFGAGTCRVRDIAKLNGVDYKDLAHGESWRWRGLDKSADKE